MSQPTRKRSGLGRGLASLIPTGPADDASAALNGPRMGSAAADVVIGGGASGGNGAPVNNGAPVVEENTVGATYREIDPSAIEPNPRQPRQVFDEEALAELVHSIREFGLMQPIVVRALPSEGGAPRYQLVMGERRWRAVQQAGLGMIPAIVRETADDSMLRDALLENIHRVQLNPLEEAAAYQQLLDEFGVTHDELAARIGRSRPVITNMIRLLRLPIAVQRRVAAGVLSAGHARALLALEGGPEKQEELAARIVAEGLSVRATEEAVTLANRSEPATPPAPRRKPIHMPGLQDVAEQLSTAFDTRVTVSLGKRKGKIVVEFGSVDDLQRIVELMKSSTD
jgi:ParB family transcriptional regulator, chromosome partitioning protein